LLLLTGTGMKYTDMITFALPEIDLAHPERATV
jgi:hypothetical protein